MSRSDSLLSELAECLGEAHVLTRPEERAPFERDWRQRWQGHARAVVRPADTTQVAQVVQRCAARGVAIVPQGGNTGLVGGSIPDGSGRQIVVSLQRMRRIRHLDIANLTLTADAGSILKDLQAAAEQSNLLFPLSLAAEGSCTIGGNLATNAGGTQVLRFGNARSLCLGLEVVTADGRIWDGLAGLRKDNTGYDLRNLFIGSEGTLGIITAATLQLYPAPQSRVTALAACDSLHHALNLLQRARQRLDASLTGFEVMNTFSLQLVARHFPSIPQGITPSPWKVLLESSGPDDDSQAQERMAALLGEALEQGYLTDAVVAQTIAQSHDLWHLRESISMAQAQEGTNIKHDISVPVSAIPGFVDATDRELARLIPGARMVTFGHMGDGNLHYNVQAPLGMDSQAFLDQYEAVANDCVYDAVVAARGSISAEHGIGELKRDELPHRKSPVAMDLMHRIKQALDPQGLMNPGRVLLPESARKSL